LIWLKTKAYHAATAVLDSFLQLLSKIFLRKKDLRTNLLAVPIVEQHGNKMTVAEVVEVSVVGTANNVKCTQLLARPAEKRPKFHSVPAVTALFTAATVSVAKGVNNNLSILS